MEVTIVIGAPRSGTSFLASMLSEQLNLHYFEEPNTIWLRGNMSKDTDVLTEFDCSHSIKADIKEKFRRYSKGRDWIEKTPNNCLRLSFIKMIFPHARIVVVYRNPRAVIASISRKWLFEADSNSLTVRGHFLKRINQQFGKFKNVKLIEMSSAMWRYRYELLHYFGVKRKFWGPRYNNYSNDSFFSVTSKAEKIWYECNKAILENIDLYDDVCFIDYDCFGDAQTKIVLDNFFKADLSPVSSYRRNKIESSLELSEKSRLLYDQLKLIAKTRNTYLLKSNNLK